MSVWCLKTSMKVPHVKVLKLTHLPLVFVDFVYVLECAQYTILTMNMKPKCAYCVVQNHDCFCIFGQKTLFLIEKGVFFV